MFLELITGVAKKLGVVIEQRPETPGFEESIVPAKIGASIERLSESPSSELAATRLPSRSPDGKKSVVTDLGLDLDPRELSKQLIGEDRDLDFTTDLELSDLSGLLAIIDQAEVQVETAGEVVSEISTELPCCKKKPGEALRNQEKTEASLLEDDLSFEDDFDPELILASTETKVDTSGEVRSEISEELPCCKPKKLVTNKDPRSAPENEATKVATLDDDLSFEDGFDPEAILASSETKVETAGEVRSEISEELPCCKKPQELVTSKEPEEMVPPADLVLEKAASSEEPRIKADLLNDDLTFDETFDSNAMLASSEVQVETAGDVKSEISSELPCCKKENQTQVHTEAVEPSLPNEEPLATQLIASQEQVADLVIHKDQEQIVKDLSANDLVSIFSAKEPQLTLELVADSERQKELAALAISEKNRVADLIESKVTAKSATDQSVDLNNSKDTRIVLTELENIVPIKRQESVITKVKEVVLEGLVDLIAIQANKFSSKTKELATVNPIVKLLDPELRKDFKLAYLAVIAELNKEIKVTLVAKLLEKYIAVTKLDRLKEFYLQAKLALKDPTIIKDLTVQQVRNFHKTFIALLSAVKSYQINAGQVAINFKLIKDYLNVSRILSKKFPVLATISKIKPLIILRVKQVVLLKKLIALRRDLRINKANYTVRQILIKKAVVRTLAKKYSLLINRIQRITNRNKINRPAVRKAVLLINKRRAMREVGKKVARLDPKLHLLVLKKLKSQIIKTNKQLSTVKNKNNGSRASNLLKAIRLQYRAALQRSKRKDLVKNTSGKLDHLTKSRLKEIRLITKFAKKIETLKLLLNDKNLHPGKFSRAIKRLKFYYKIKIQKLKSHEELLFFLMQLSLMYKKPNRQSAGLSLFEINAEYLAKILASDSEDSADEIDKLLTQILAVALDDDVSQLIDRLKQKKAKRVKKFSPFDVADCRVDFAKEKEEKTDNLICM